MGWKEVLEPVAAPPPVIGRCRAHFKSKMAKKRVASGHMVGRGDQIDRFWRDRGTESRVLVGIQAFAFDRKTHRLWRVGLFEGQVEGLDDLLNRSSGTLTLHTGDDEGEFGCVCQHEAVEDSFGARRGCGKVGCAFNLSATQDYDGPGCGGGFWVVAVFEVFDEQIGEGMKGQKPYAKPQKEKDSAPKVKKQNEKECDEESRRQQEGRYKL